MRNQTVFPESELVLTPEGKVYHLNLSGDEIADDVIVVGDQDRVAMIASKFEKVIHKSHHREFYAQTGYYNGKLITALSTGIGTDNIDIVLNELDAAVNIDPKTRTVNQHLRKLNIIRIGTSGSLQADIPVDTYVASEFAIGFDGVMHFYNTTYTEIEQRLAAEFTAASQWNKKLAAPYVVQCNVDLKNKIAFDMQMGITATANGFFGPQGRKLRIPLYDENLNQKLNAFSYEGFKLTNFEMETSTLYGLGRALNHNCLTVCLIVANRFNKSFSTKYQEKMHGLIDTVLDRLTK